MLNSTSNQVAELGQAHHPLPDAVAAPAESELIGRKIYDKFGPRRFDEGVVRNCEIGSSREEIERDVMSILVCCGAVTITAQNQTVTVRVQVRAADSSGVWVCRGTHLVGSMRFPRRHTVRSAEWVCDLVFKSRTWSLVDQNSVSWNRWLAWLRQIDGFRRTA